jgi:hypothetical protein
MIKYQCVMCNVYRVIHKVMKACSKVLIISQSRPRFHLVVRISNCIIARSH